MKGESESGDRERCEVSGEDWGFIRRRTRVVAEVFRCRWMYKVCKDVEPVCCGILSTRGSAYAS